MPYSKTPLLTSGKTPGICPGPITLVFVFRFQPHKQPVPASKPLTLFAFQCGLQVQSLFPKFINFDLQSLGFDYENQLTCSNA